MSIDEIDVALPAIYLRAREKIASLQNKGDELQRAMYEEQKRVVDLDLALKHLDQHIAKLRLERKMNASIIINQTTITPKPAERSAGTGGFGREASKNVMKKINMLEKRLENGLTRKSNVQNDNATLKTHINDYRKRRLVSNRTHRNLEVNLHKIKSKIEQMFEQSNEILEISEELTRKRTDLEEKNNEEKRIFDEQMDEMETYTKEQKKLLEHELTKPDIDLNTARKYKEDIESNKRNHIHLPNNAVIDQYHEAFRRLKEICEVSHFDDVITCFLSNEDDIFSLFNYIQTITMEYDDLKQYNSTMDLNIHNFEEELRTRHEKTSKLLNQIRKKRDMLGEMKEIFSSKTGSSQHHIHRYSKKIQTLFFKIQCDQIDPNKTHQKTATTQLSVGVNEINILEYLGIIEEKTMDIINDYSKIVDKIKKKKKNKGRSKRSININ